MSATAPAAPRTTVTRPSLARLSAVEVRKVLDTRAERWFLAAIAALVLLAVGSYLVQADGPLVLADALSGPGDVLRLLLPALGVLSMTGEWTQRTALTTFALVPRRGRVLIAKPVTLLAITLAVDLVTAAVCALGIAVTAPFTAQSADLSGSVVGAGEVLVVLSLGAQPAAWVNIVLAINDASDFRLDPPIAPTLTALVLWLVLPLIAGTVRTLRRQVS